jgi:pimeloyl-ACP methyl ester carboxylesterase
LFVRVTVPRPHGLAVYRLGLRGVEYETGFMQRRRPPEHRSAAGPLWRKESAVNKSDRDSGRTGASATARPIRRVRSADGVTIVLEQVTHGPVDLVLVAGGPNRRSRWGAAAALLDGVVSCWLMDRRGKGDSGDSEDPAAYSFEREYEDLAAVVDSFSGPVGIGGHSSGATCALGAAVHGLPIASLMLYEPPWPVDGPLAGAEFIDRMEALIDQGNRDEALELAFTKMVGMPTEAVAALRHSPMWQEWRALAHTWPREMREASDLCRDPSRFATVTTPALVLVGALSPAHLQRSTRAIAAAMPHATVVELPGQGHGALDRAPHLVAEAIAAFVGTPS